MHLEPLWGGMHLADVKRAKTLRHRSTFGPRTSAALMKYLPTWGPSDLAHHVCGGDTKVRATWSNPPVQSISGYLPGGLAFGSTGYGTPSRRVCKLLIRAASLLRTHANCCSAIPGHHNDHAGQANQPLVHPIAMPSEQAAGSNLPAEAIGARMTCERGVPSALCRFGPLSLRPSVSAWLRHPTDRAVVPQASKASRTKIVLDWMSVGSAEFKAPVSPDAAWFNAAVMVRRSAPE